MLHMRLWLISLSLLCGSSCTHFGDAALSVKPPIHPLLSTAEWRVRVPKPTLTFAPKPLRYNSAAETVLKGNMSKLSPKAFLQPADELNLVRAIYQHTHLRKTFGNVHSVSELRAIGRRAIGDARTGDILFFDQNIAPRLAVVQRTRSDGTIVAKGIVRGRLRTVFVHLQRPTQRRSKGHILNTFIKVIKPGGKRADRFLAGELVVARKRYLRSARFGN